MITRSRVVAGTNQLHHIRYQRSNASLTQETFNYYVNPSGGSDSNPGSVASPFASLAHALSVATAGQSVGVKCGTTTRNGSSLSTTVSAITIGSYGAGAKPIITGGVLVSTWTSTAGGTNLVTNPGFESGLTGWTILVAGPAIDTTQHHSGTQSMQITNGTGKLTQTVSLVSGTSYTLSLWHIESVTGKSGSYQFFTGTNYLQGDGTWSTTGTQTNVNTNSTTWVQVSITFTAPSTGSYTLLLQGFDGGTYTTNYDDLSIAAGGGTAGTYSASASQPAGTPGMVVAGTQALTLGGSASTLTTNQWFWAASLLYVNLGGTNPSSVTVEVANVQSVLNFTTASQQVTLRGLDVRFAVNAALALNGIGRFLVDSCNFQWTVYTSNSGNLLIQNCTGTGNRVTRSTFDQLLNDGIWGHNTSNVEVSHNTMTNIGSLPGDVQSDGVQWEDTFGTNPTSQNIWVHHNTISMGTASPKGCILINADSSTGAVVSSIVEYNTCTGGNYGVAPHANNCIARFNTSTNVASTYGGGIHVDSAYVLDSVSIYCNLITGSNRNGIVLQDGSNNRTNFTIANNTIVNSGFAQMYIGAPISGLIENNIAWYSGAAPSLRTLYILSVVAAHTLTCDYNDLGTAFANYLRDGSNQYSTLAAWQSATTRDAHSIQGDPLLTGSFTLGVGSPCIGTGTVVAGVTVGATPNMGWA